MAQAQLSMSDGELWIGIISGKYSDRMLGPRKSSKPRIGISPFEGFWKVTHRVVKDLLDWDFSDKPYRIFTCTAFCSSMQYPWYRRD